MGNSQWHDDQLVGEMALRDLKRRSANDEELGAAVRRVIFTGGVDSETPESLRDHAALLRRDGSKFAAVVLETIANTVEIEPK